MAELIKVNILGTEYTIIESDKKDDKILEDIDGYCDKTTKTIVITTQSPDSDLGNWNVYRKKILRHEIIHAFLFESGLHENFEHKQWGHDETFVDWVAVQLPKMNEVFKKVGCLNG